MLEGNSFRRECGVYLNVGRACTDCMGPSPSARGLLTVDALLLEADVGALRRLPERLELVQTPLPADAEFLSDMTGRLDPVGYEVLSENSGRLLLRYSEGTWEDGSLRPKAECCYPALASALFLALYRFFIPPAVLSLYFHPPSLFRRAAGPVAPASSPDTVRQSLPGPDSIFRCR